jgi:hypothetical protein
MGEEPISVDGLEESHGAIDEAVSSDVGGKAVSSSSCSTLGWAAHSARMAISVA